MVDLKGQYHKIKKEIDDAVLSVIESTQFIKGPVVKSFEEKLAAYLGVKHVIGCGNGTDALQIAMMALELKPGDEVIVPAFTYVATAEVIALLGLVPIMVDVNLDDFNIKIDEIEEKITNKTKAIVPVHLFGQNADMESILRLAEKHNLYVIEDAAQSLGSTYQNKKSGTIGDIGCTSFFPTKNLGCMGDGGALFTNNDDLAAKIRMIASHGQIKKYHHSVIGVNSRLDALQAAILDVKLKYLDDYATARRTAADRYDHLITTSENIKTPKRNKNSDHVFHQYTLQSDQREAYIKKLKEKNIPNNIYYPIPLYRQEAFKRGNEDLYLPNTEQLCKTVFSLPMHTELTNDQQEFIVNQLLS
ncbi:cell surface polysaccharide biosynthesis protein [Portibacter lacus]|uniref:Cell surface polysaccharide biosynthesis protein n=2 Tax=Portibacter lacus TaxID=1099794 RepID=A0AA37WFF5_9BACT|nr:DegT/DnrJ/EryC1/StrS family aminotransferase [Portibacter lacus]GLR18838.1 cell surface polysaccharide biosynthesis protein [Portibacter lacus]